MSRVDESTPAQLSLTRLVHISRFVFAVSGRGFRLREWGGGVRVEGVSGTPLSLTRRVAYGWRRVEEGGGRWRTVEDGLRRVVEGGGWKVVDGQRVEGGGW